MAHRTSAFLGALAILFVASAGAQNQAVRPATAAKAKSSALPRLPDGYPDLQGLWTNATLTPLERPGAFSGKPAIKEAEAEEYIKRNSETFNIDRREGGAEVDVSRAYNNLFIDRGTKLATVDGVIRTSLIIDPPEGRVPPLSPEGQKRTTARAASVRGHTFDGPEMRPLGERCLLGFGSTSGPPMLPVLYNNNYQIIQSPKAVMILVEMVHDVRVIHLDRTLHLASNIRQWMGDSIGHWEGDTLVVDTTNFTDKTRFRGSSENLHVIERFTRTDANTFLYRVTIDDPQTFSKTWTAEYPFLATSGPIFEYACHEGNYALGDILRGAREEEKAAEAAKKK